MSKSFAAKALALVVLFISLLAGAVCQDLDPGVANGLQSFETHDGEISLDNLNIHLDIPLVEKTGVGLPFSFGLHFNNNFWTPYSACIKSEGGYSCWQPNASVWGWLPDAAQGTGAFIVRPYVNDCQDNSQWFNILEFTAYQDPQGNTHLITNSKGEAGTANVAQNVSGWQGCQVNGTELTLTLPAIDNSGLTFNLTYPNDAEAYVGPFPTPGSGVPTVTLSDGTVLTPGLSYYGDYEPVQGLPIVFQLPHHISGTSITNTNHNSITIPAQQSWPAYGITPAGPYAFTDTLGVGEVTIAPEVFTGLGAGNSFQGPSGPAGPCASSGNETYTYPTGPTTTATVTLSCKQYTIATNFGCYYMKEWPVASGASNWTANLINSITLADGAQYQFTYESQAAGTVTGRLASVTYPSGNVVTYSYFTAPTGNNNPPGYTYFSQGTACGDGSVIGLTRSDASGTWTYTRNTTAYTTIVQGPAPANNTSVYTFDNKEGVFGTSLLTEEQDYQGPQTTLLKTQTFCYNGNQTNCTSATGIGYPITQRDVYTTVPGVSQGPSRTTAKFDSYGNTTETDDYDFGASTPTRKTVASGYGYTWNGSTTSPNCSTAIGSGVNGAPCQVQLQNGSGAMLRNSYFAYGTTTNPGSLLSKAVLTGGSSYLSSSYAYNANGTVSTITDENGNQTSLSYGDCNGSMLTKLTVWPVPTVSSLAEQFQWDSGCNMAVVMSLTDPNGKISSAAYNDPFWRPTSLTDELNNTIYLSYSPTTLEAQESFNSGSSDFDVFDTSDSLGRALYSQVIEGPGGNWDTQQSGYTWNSTGQMTTITAPCVAATKGSGCSTAQSTVTHDALGRPLVQTDGGGGTTTYTYTGRDVLTVIGPAPAGEVVKKIQKEYNGLGQLLSSCQLSSATGSTSCGQDSGGTGFVTTYLYNSDGTTASISRKSSTNTQTHLFTYDATGRTLTATYPESGTNRFFYDVPPATPGVACSTIVPSGTPSQFYGQLTKTVDANGNTTCYAYDGADRVTSISYAGPNFDGNNKYFVYDSATVDGTAMANATGRLAEAYTAASISGTKVTDEGFSYDVRGEITDVYESTPNSLEYYHTTSTYFANGVVNTLSGVTGGPWTFSIDGKGRPYSAIQGASTNLVSSTTYNAADQPLVVTLGLGDSDTYTYDSNTGRMTNYTFTVGATPESISGTLTWNQNATLRQLAITDGVNSAGTQTCNYGTSTTAGYDELGRLLSVDCGASIWQQTFSYDPFNNLTKSVPQGGTGITWQPGYNQANNQYLLGGTSYDKNGNLLTDTFHTYTWNQDNLPLSVVDAGVTATNDAFGNSVERQTGSTYAETLLTPVGSLGVMNKKNVSQLRVPLPGGPTAVSGIDFWHTDWLGSVRFVSSRGNRTSLVDRAFAPYGETANNIGATTNVNFTGDSQDLVVGTFDTPDRELNPNQGRWISPDPAHAGWNAYAYSTNPLGTTDPTGQDDGPCQTCLYFPDSDYWDYMDDQAWSQIFQDQELQDQLNQATEANIQSTEQQMAQMDIASTANYGSISPFANGTGPYAQGAGFGTQPVGAPGFWEGMIPIWGSGRSAINDFQTGHWGWGLVQTGVAISDVFLVKAAFTTVGKLGIEGLAKFGGSNAWGATRSWLAKQGWEEFAGQEFHHWFVPQNQWGRMVPDLVKNQPWNLMRMESQVFHNAIEGKGVQAMGMAGRLWFGSPTWAKVLLTNSLLRGTTQFQPEW